jgi:dTDP-4-amino-4,6-dideoxygalactose transaminase
MAAIYMLAQVYEFKIIEDASHAIGGRYKGETIGCGRYSDITVFSFHPVKIITTAEGGMALTNNEQLADRMSLLRSHGITRDAGAMTQNPDGPWYYEQLALGYNYRMTDMQAALGISQMRRIDAFVSRRMELAQRYDQLLRVLPVTTPWQHPDSNSCWHLYVIRLNPELTGRTRLQVFESLREQGVGANLHYIPIYRQPYYQGMGFMPAEYPEAEKYYEQAISLPMFPGMDDGKQELVVNALQKAICV